MNEKKTTILVVDSEVHVQKMMGIILDIGNFKIIESSSGKQAIRMCVSTKPDLVLLAFNLQDMNSEDIIRSIREWSQVPIIVVSIPSSDKDIARILNIGANDYITKPFNTDVLIARINASLRNSMVCETGNSELRNGCLRMDLMRHEVFLNDKPIKFTPKEYDLLKLFMTNLGKMLTHREILKKVWGDAHTDNTTYLRVYIGQIRGKIEDNLMLPVFITTEPSVGYRMEALSQDDAQKSLF